TRKRAGEFHDGLGRFDLADDLVDVNLVPWLHVPGEDLGLGEAFAHVGQHKLLDSLVSHAQPSSTRTCGRHRRGPGPGPGGSTPPTGTADRGCRIRRRE